MSRPLTSEAASAKIVWAVTVHTLLNDEPATPADVVSILDAHPDNVSVQLSRCHETGLLDRRRNIGSSRPTGYEYTLRIPEEAPTDE